MENIGKNRPRVDVDSWTEADAAEHWSPGYGSGDDHNPLPASIVTGVVARLFAQEYFNCPPMAELLRQWQHEGRLAEPNNFRSPHQFLTTDKTLVAQWMQAGDHPDFSKHPNAMPCVHWLNNATLGYCGRKTCTFRQSVLNGCMSEGAFVSLDSCGYFVPWSSVRWEGLSVLLPLMRQSLDTPYIAIRRERSHVKKPVVPYYIAETFNTLSRIVPQVMASTPFTNAVKNRLPVYLERIKTERLRFHAIVAMGSDPEKAMREWDNSFSVAAWDSKCGLEDGPTPYDTANGALLGVDSDEHEKLIETVATDLFPTLPDLPSEDD